MVSLSEASTSPDKDPTYLAEAYRCLIDVSQQCVSSSAVPQSMYICIRTCILHPHRSVARDTNIMIRSGTHAVLVSTGGPGADD